MSKPIVNESGLKALTQAGIAVDNEQSDIQTIAESDMAKLAADDSFMNEPIQVRIAPSINPNDSPYAAITVSTIGGQTERVVIGRGVVTHCKRMHIEVLARLKQVSYHQRPSPSIDLELGNRLFANTGLVYPFEIISDANPRGKPWLENILAEPV